MTRARDIADFSGGLVLLGTKNIVSGLASTTVLQLNDVFSADFQNYRVNFDIIAVGDAARGTTSGFFMGFGNSGTIRTSGDVWNGAILYYQSNTANSGTFSSEATDSCGVAGTFTTQEVQIVGHSIISNPFSSSAPHEVLTHMMMNYIGEADSQYYESSFAVTTDSNFSTTDMNFQACTGISTTSSNDVSGLTKINVHGEFRVYGIKDSF